MKKARVVLLLGVMVVAGALASSCSSSKNSAYPKRLQRSVKCPRSSNETIKEIKEKQKATVIAYNQVEGSSVAS